MMEAVRITETSVFSNEATRRYMPEGCHHQKTLLSLNNQSTSHRIKEDEKGSALPLNCGQLRVGKAK
jgi:hypothetical protein